ncbi:hypothetical protein GCM10020331_091690 [Ectobacillus funiculus]
MSSKQRVPLPASNSLAAKQMRVVAGLIIFGEALAEHIFRPTHITHGRELDEVLAHLGTQNPLQEMYVRSALLKVLPDRQQKEPGSCGQVGRYTRVGCVKHPSAFFATRGV